MSISTHREIFVKQITELHNSIKSKKYTYLNLKHTPITVSSSNEWKDDNFSFYCSISCGVHSRGEVVVVFQSTITDNTGKATNVCISIEDTIIKQAYSEIVEEYTSDWYDTNILEIELHKMTEEYMFQLSTVNEVFIDEEVTKTLLDFKTYLSSLVHKLIKEEQETM